MVPSKPDLGISSAKHCAVLEVDEEGTRAAAATEICMADGLAAPHPKRPELFCDRPFLFLVRSPPSMTRKHIVHFIRRFSNPEKAENPAGQTIQKKPKLLKELKNPLKI